MLAGHLVLGSGYSLANTGITGWNMNVWFNEAKESCTCVEASCQRPIACGEFVALSRQHGALVSWHPECLVNASKRMLDRKPRSKFSLDDVGQARRLSLLRQYAANKQRIGVYAKRLPHPVFELRIQRIQILQQLIRLRIADVGGVPKGWQPATTSQEVAS